MKKLFLFLMTLSTLQAMEQPEKEPTFKYFKLLPIEIQKLIALYVADAPTVKEAYTNVMSLLQVDSQLSSLRDDEDFMTQLVDLLITKFASIKEDDQDLNAEYKLDNWIDIARATKSKYALSLLKKWFDTLPLADKRLFLQQYFQFKLDTKQFGDARFLLNNLHLFSKALENITALEKAALLKENKLKKWLVHLGLKGSQKNLSPLHHATARENLKVMQFLIEHGADINAQVAGFTPLLGAILHKKEAAANYLIEQGANVNIPHPDGRMTPLMLAIIAGKPQLIRKLIQHGANIHAMNADGETALNMAQTFDRVRETNLFEILKAEERKLFEKKMQQYKTDAIKSSKEEVDDDLD